MKLVSCHILNHRSKISPRHASEYSRMKYGDPRATLSITRKMLKVIRKDPEIAAELAKKDIVLTSSPYGYVPTASHAIVRQMARLLKAEGINIDIAKIERTGVMGETHYCAMTKEAREQFMKQRKTWIDNHDKKLIKGRFVLAIDDLSATGNHVLDMDSILKTTEARNYKFAIYIQFSQDLAETDAGAEGFISRSKIKSVKDLIPFFHKPADKNLELRLNTRTLKFILQVSPASENDYQEETKRQYLRLFLSSCDDYALSLIKNACNSSDGYTDFEKFSEGIEMVNSEIASRKRQKIEAPERKIYFSEEFADNGDLAAI